MAATVSPWAKPGAWALDSEQHEAELHQLQQNENQPISGIPTEPLADFPSLSAAATSKSKKKKGQTISLAEFTAKPTQPSYQQHQGLTPEEFLALPTGPRERSAEELDRNRLGGGFRSYGSNDSSNSRWGSSRVSDEPRRNGSFKRDRESAPSRADEIDNWAAEKKSTVGSNGFERRERGGGFFNSQSRADDTDNWGSNKAFAPSADGRRSGGERKVGFASDGGADSDNWAKNKKEVSSVGGAGTERPRLNLQPRTLPVSNGDKQEAAGMVSKPSRGSNPFGEARPREDVLAEKGKDWKKIDEQLEATKMKEVAEKADGSSSFGKRGFGLGNVRAAGVEDNRTWRRPGSVESRPQSAEKIENIPGEEKSGELICDAEI
ncbi:eukaryotic translation initiation factor 4B3 isoform X2 [Juglans microcarpa x Juglans regia]|uniref:eukaryotic translation initiation factor 4B3 isoform X2 n=1 Tax=Juglans microcarpa x Juglans regia TaxID=2249226 RepID=UPI001B7DDE39|nr:eukaryotic translation initiation factor 4B3 isoform X2 [Juglans microcarpa x Juglans regia]